MPLSVAMRLNYRCQVERVSPSCSQFHSFHISLVLSSFRFQTAMAPKMQQPLATKKDRTLNPWACNPLQMRLSMERLQNQVRADARELKE
eukprot:217063-Pyramimonas_sp.AAC.1